PSQRRRIASVPYSLMASAKLQEIVRKLQRQLQRCLLSFKAEQFPCKVWRKGRQRQVSPALILRRWQGCVGVCAYMFDRLWRDQGGASLLEYSLLVAVITMIVVIGVAVAGAWAQSMWAQLLPRLG